MKHAARMKLTARVEHLTLKGIGISATAHTGRVRVFAGPGGMELAPDVSASEMSTWLDGFEAALRLLGKL